jgi:hypothetical protein
MYSLAGVKYSNPKGAQICSVDIITVMKKISSWLVYFGQLFLYIYVLYESVLVENDVLYVGQEANV